MVPYTSGKIWSTRLIFLFFLAVCLNISTVINIQILTNSNKQTQSYKFTSHHSSFSVWGFDHRDAWNLHTNIIWSKRSTDFKELSPCGVWYHLKYNNAFRNSLKSSVPTKIGMPRIIICYRSFPCLGLNKSDKYKWFICRLYVGVVIFLYC